MLFVVQKLCVLVLALKSVELKCFLLVLSSRLPHFREQVKFFFETHSSSV